MRTILGWRQVLAHRYGVTARTRLHARSLACFLTGLVVLSTVSVPSRAVAGDAASNPASQIEDGQPAVPDVEPGATRSSYVPRLIGAPRLRGAQAAATQKQLPGATVDCPACDPVGVFVPEIFPASLRIDQDWLPLEPGTEFVLQGQANRGGGLLPHTVTFIVTDLVKKINGIPCRVVWDRDVNQGVLSESELAFFAQDKDGNIWLAGEYPEEYERGSFAGAENTWYHGVERAVAGVPIRANPILGTPGFQQALAPENDFWDCGEVLATDRVTTCVPHRCFKDVVTIKEWAPFDGCGVIQFKTYARGVGVIKVGALNDPEGETLVLANRSELNQPQMDSVRAAVIALDAHGYQVNENHSKTSPVYLAAHWAKPDGNHTGSQALAPARSELLWVAPNPVTRSTGIAYSVAQAGRVEISIYDVTGRRVRSLVDEAAAPGSYHVQWDARDDGGAFVARGVYFARLRAGTQVVQKTLVVSK